jgi:hypothetical protein
VFHGFRPDGARSETRRPLTVQEPCYSVPEEQTSDSERVHGTVRARQWRKAMVDILGGGSVQSSEGARLSMLANGRRGGRNGRRSDVTIRGQKE